MGAGTHVACNVQRLFYCFTGELGVVASKGVIVGGSGGVRPRQFSSLEWEQGKGPRSPGRRRRALKRWPLVVGPGRRRFPFSPFSSGSHRRLGRRSVPGSAHSMPALPVRSLRPPTCVSNHGVSRNSRIAAQHLVLPRGAREGEIQSPVKQQSGVCLIRSRLLQTNAP
jgi:hypothetical protein